MANSATFRIRRVKCIDEMGGKWREKFGNDEIKAAIFSADLRGSTVNSGRVDIYPDFDDGDVKTFNPPKEVVTLDLAGYEGEAELGFSVILIESQIRRGDGLEKAWQKFVDYYEEALKKELSQKLSINPDQARSLATPKYLSPIPQLTGMNAGRFSLNPASIRGNLRVTGSTESIAASDTETSGENSDGSGINLQKLGDAFGSALITAVALIAVRFAGSAINALIGWAQDKFFPPQPINVKFDASTSPGNVPDGASGVVEFRGHGGHYEMEWDLLLR
ncbi:hypothetical protein [Membranihabitans maritimus]|uniref:hypothetical protein n=1 Tax=Membranihabitans maritimus TaxID=2904244 RepID=UPI001F21A61B|nr:hypothetical protein [Membranihabitans maritimus]